MMSPSKTRGSGSPRRWFAPAVPLVLFGLWVLLSGKLDAFHLGTGAAAVVFIMWLNRALAPFDAAEAPRLRALRLIPYGLWLFGEMILAAVYVARVVINPRKHLDPRLIHFRSDQPSIVNGVVFANSITLTPGTITVDFDDNRYIVHALTPRTAQGVLDGGMARRVARLSSDEPIPPPKVLKGMNRSGPP